MKNYNYLYGAAFVAISPALFAQTPLWSANGSLPNSSLGHSVTVIGDFNGNGTDDVLIGEPGDTGALFVSGGGSASVRDGDGSCITIFYGGQGQLMGVSTARLPDINGDGIDEILIGSPGNNYPSPTVLNGRVAMYFGGNNGAAGCTGAGASTPDLLINAGIANTAIQSSGDEFGSEIKAVGDVNGDGIADFAVGAPQGNSTMTVGDQRGYVQIFSGQAAANGVQTQLGITLPGPVGNSHFGFQISDIGDVDGDGLGDFAVGSHNESLGLDFANGGVRFFSGLTGVPFLTLNGTDQSRLGWAIENLGDLDGDGLDEIALGAPGFSPSPGSTRVGTVTVVTGASLAADAAAFSGTSIVRALALQPALYTVRGDDLYNNQAVNNPPVSDDQLGTSIASIGDVDGDGINDWVAGAPGSSLWDPNFGIANIWPEWNTMSPTSGSARLISGAAGNTIRQYWPQNPADGDCFGCSVAGGGDFNGDGIQDFIVGAQEKTTLNGGDGSVFAFSSFTTFGEVYGNGQPNSTGMPGSLTIAGSQSLAANDLTFIVQDVPAEVFGILLMAPGQRLNPGVVGEGLQYLSNPMYRIAYTTTVPAPLAAPGSNLGQAIIDLDATSGSAGTFLVPYQRFNFTFYHRDENQNGSTLNLTDAITTGGFYQ